MELAGGRLVNQPRVLGETSHKRNQGHGASKGKQQHQAVTPHHRAP